MLKQWLTAMAGVLCGMIWMYGFATPTQAQPVTCNLINYQDAMIVFHAPIYSHAQIKDVLAKDEPYLMTGASGGFFQIEYHEGKQGWIDYHTRILNGACTPYLDNPPEPIRITEFPTVCTYTTAEAVIGFGDSDLTQIHPGFGEVPAGTYGVVSIHDTAIELEGASDMSGAYVDISSGTLDGHCRGTLQLATTLDNARLWTEPDVTTGEIIITLDIGTIVGIISEPVNGRLQYDTDLMGDWVEVRTGSMETGWVWIERLMLDSTFTAPNIASPKHTLVTDNARLWSEPNAKTGQIIMTIPTGASVNITGAAQIGFIQYESDLQGAWYPVDYNNTTGWLYEGRINFGN